MIQLTHINIAKCCIYFELLFMFDLLLVQRVTAVTTHGYMIHKLYLYLKRLGGVFGWFTGLGLLLRQLNPVISA